VPVRTTQRAIRSLVFFFTAVKRELKEIVLMTEADRALIAVMLENVLLAKTEQAFEDFFVQAGTTLWGRDFEPWRPQGRIGDMKCDGYRISEKAVFQCHAPEKFVAASVAKKIRVDFTEARNAFGSKLEKWVFVHNHRDGLPAEAEMLVLNLRADPRSY
jgi:hypothetical protein